jgi:hypothetical protein
LHAPQGTPQGLGPATQVPEPRQKAPKEAGSRTDKAPVAQPVLTMCWIINKEVGVLKKTMWC